MPNWVKTKLHFNTTKRRFNEIMKALLVEDQDGEEDLDFNNVIKMPDEIFRGNLGAAEREKYGTNNWYDWSVANWGTKWNAVDTEVDYVGLNVIYSTAWSFAEPIVREIARKFKVDIEFEYVNEDFYGSAGYGSCDRYGSWEIEYPSEDSDERWAIIEELWCVRREDCAEPDEELLPF